MVIHPLLEFQHRGIEIQEVYFQHYDKYMFRVLGNPTVRHLEVSSYEAVLYGIDILKHLEIICAKVCMLDVIGESVMTLPMDTDHGNGD